MVLFPLALAGATSSQTPTQAPVQQHLEAPAPALAQTSSDHAQAPVPARPAAPEQPTQTCNPSKATVACVYKEGDQCTDKELTVQLRDTIVVQVKDLESLLAEAKCTGKADKPEDIVLFLEDRPLTDIVASPPTDPSQNLLEFPLRRTEATRDVWTYLLGRPSLTREMKVSIGLRNKYAIPSEKRVTLAVIPIGWFVAWSLLLIIFLIGFWLLAKKTDLLRDPVPAPGGAARRPYSLARTQASWWFFLVLASYMFIGMITGDFSTSITGTVLILMGISAGTAVSSAFVDASKVNPETTRRQVDLEQSLRTQLNQLESDIKVAKEARDTNPQDTAAQQTWKAKTAEYDDRLSQLHKLDNESEQFLQDMLSDANGVNFHRFQMLAWTIVLGIIFVSSVYRDMAMPDFNSTLLSLMGISAGTYIGLKIPEDTVPKTQG
jgi:hypothetical protein